MTTAGTRKAVAALEFDKQAVKAVLAALLAHYGDHGAVGDQTRDLWNAAHDAETAIDAEIAAIESAARWAAIPPEQMGNAILAIQNID
jgi:hypothetical protein